jgi:hypothetical protein
MRIVINHDNCKHADAFATRCLAETMQFPLGHQRYCAAEAVDDGKSELTVVLVFDGEEHTLVLRDEAERETVASEGWPAFLSSRAVIAPAA